MAKPYVDSNIFLRFLKVENDSKNKVLSEKAKRIWREISVGNLEVQTSILIVAEVVYVLRSHYKVSMKRIEKLLVPLLFLKNLELDSKKLVLEALHLSSEKNVDFTDALTSLQMKKQKSTSIYTFDRKHFKRLEGVEILEDVDV